MCFFALWFWELRWLFQAFLFQDGVLGSVYCALHSNDYPHNIDKINLSARKDHQQNSLPWQLSIPKQVVHFSAPFTFTVYFKRTLQILLMSVLCISS